VKVLPQVDTGSVKFLRQRSIVLVFTLALTVTSAGSAFGARPASAVTSAKPTEGAGAKLHPDFTTTSPLYTQGEMFGGSNSAALCYTCEAADITGAAPPSESLDTGSGVNTLTGDYSTTNNLFGSAPGVGLSLGLTYDAQLAQAEVTAGSNAYGEFGVGWSSSFDASVTPQSGGTTTNSVTVTQANGAQDTFNQSASGGTSTSCPTGDYSTTNKYTINSYDSYSTTDQWCALASVQAQFYNLAGSEMVFQTNGGQSMELFSWNGSLGDVSSYSSQKGQSTVYLYYDVAAGGTLLDPPPCPSTATDCIDEESNGDHGSTENWTVESLNTLGLVTQVTDPSGVTYDMTYNSSKDLTSEESFANQTAPSTWYYVYTTSASSPNSSNLEEVYDPDSGATSSTGYSAGAAHSNSIVYYTSGSDSGMVNLIEDGTGAETTYSYADPCDTGQCVATNAAQQTTVTYPAQVPSPGGAAASPVEVDTYVGGVESSTSLGSSSNSYNNETWGYNWSLGYGASNSTETITYPNSLAGGTAPTATVVLDPAGNVISTTNALGDVATSAYNDVGGNNFPELLWSYPGSSSNGPTNPPSGSWVYTYNSSGQVLTATDPLGDKTTYGYFASDDDPCFVAQPTVSMSGYSSSCTGYGTAGPMYAPPGSTGYKYDDYGNVIATYVDYIDSSNGADPQTTTASYNIMGDELWSIPPAGQSGSQSSSNPYATVTTYTPANLPLTVTRPGQSTVTNTYDAALNLVSSASSSTATSTYYDPDNRPCYQVVAGSVQTLTSCPTPASGTGQTTVLAGSSVTTYVPGSTSVASSTDGNGYTTWSYYGDLAYPSSPTEVVDSLDNEVQYTAYNDFGDACVSGDVSLASQQGTSSQCSSVSGDMSAAYNALGGETSVTDPSGNTTTNTFTNTAYPTLETSTENALSKTTSYSYDADGREMETTNPDGSTVYTDYDADGRVCTVSDTGTNYACDAGSGASGVTNYLYNGASDPTTVTAASLTGASQISNFGGGCALSLGSNKTVECWNDYAYALNGASTLSLTPVAVPGLTGVTQVSAGSISNCALLSGGTVDCWGLNNYGQLGNGTATSSATPVTVSGLSGVTQISSNGVFACALLSAGTVDCWGYNGSGQLGNGTTTNESTPVAVSGLSNVTQVSVAGGERLCTHLGRYRRLLGRQLRGSARQRLPVSDAFVYATRSERDLGSDAGERWRGGRVRAPLRRLGRLLGL
jgi:YD repeat-containing protein